MIETQTIIFIGLVSGFMGTAAMTASQYIEIGFTKRQASLTPAIIASKLFRFDLASLQEQNRHLLNHVMHWSYGTLWGIVLALVHVAFETSVLGSVILYFLIFWIQGLIVLRVFGIAPAVWHWEKKWIGIDALHHFVYAATVAIIHAVPIVSVFFA
jgi:hypothetical protein